MKFATHGVSVSRFLGVIVSALLLLSVVGCLSQREGMGPEALGSLSEIPGKTSSVRFQVIAPENVRASLFGSGMSVSCTLTLLPSSPTGKAVVFSKVGVVDESGTAQVVFFSVPVGTIIGELAINGGGVGGVSLFHGACDLTGSGTETITVEAQGGRGVRDVVAQALKNLLATPEFAGVFQTGLAASVTAIIDVPGTDLQKSDAYEALTLQVVQKITSRPQLMVGPLLGSSYWNGQPASLSVDVPAELGVVDKVAFSAGSVEMGEDTVAPFSWPIAKISGTMTFSALLTFGDGSTMTVTRQVVGKDFVQGGKAVTNDGVLRSMVPIAPTDTATPTPSVTGVPYAVATFVVTLSDEIDVTPDHFALKIENLSRVMPNGRFESVIVEAIQSQSLRIRKVGKDLVMTVTGKLSSAYNYRIQLYDGQVSIGGRLLVLNRTNTPSFSFSTIP